MIFFLKKMGRLFSKRCLNYLTFALGLLGNGIVKVKADDCTIFQNAMQTVDKAKYENMGNCCSTNMVTCENNTITKMYIYKYI